MPLIPRLTVALPRQPSIDKKAIYGPVAYCYLLHSGCRCMRTSPSCGDHTSRFFFQLYASSYPLSLLPLIRQIPQRYLSLPRASVLPFPYPTHLRSLSFCPFPFNFCVFMILEILSGRMQQALPAGADPGKARLQRGATENAGKGKRRHKIARVENARK